MSAFGGKADSTCRCSECPLLTQSGHGGWHRERGGKPLGRAEIALCGALWRLARGWVPASCYASRVRRPDSSIRLSLLYPQQPTFRQQCPLSIRFNWNVGLAPESGRCSPLRFWSGFSQKTDLRIFHTPGYTNERQLGATLELNASRTTKEAAKAISQAA